MWEDKSKQALTTVHRPCGFTNEEREVAARFDVKKEIEDFNKTRADYFSLPLPLMKRIEGNTVALIEVLMQTYGFSEYDARMYASFQKKMIWKEEKGNHYPYHEMLKSSYKLPDEVVMRVLQEDIDIDDAVMEVHNLSRSTAYNVMRGRISIEDALAGKDIPQWTPLSVMHGLVYAAAKS